MYRIVIQSRPTQTLPPAVLLFRAHGRFAWRALRRLGVPERDLDDAVQEVFLVVHRRRNDVYADTRIETWIYGVCVRVAAGHRRLAHVRKETPSEEPWADAAVPPAEFSNPLRDVESRQALARLQRVLQSMPPAMREVFVLYELEQLNLRETAVALGIPEGTATSRLYAARRAVRAAFADAGHREAST